MSALQGKKIISLATGSLHCVACSDEGEVYTWGDNDEGQLGDGTTNAILRPRLVQSLQVQKIFFLSIKYRVSLKGFYTLLPHDKNKLISVNLS